MLEDQYEKFVIEREKLADFAPPAPYGWTQLTDTLPIEWLAYSQFMQEHTSEISNSINEFRRYVGNLLAWQEVIQTLEGDELHKTIIEHVTPIAILALLMPYVIRSRFIYSIAHLSHQANKLKKCKQWSDDLPIDTEIYFEQADEYGKSWSSYSKLKRELEKIANKKYSSDTNDFRNSFNHRYSPKIELGLTGLTKRIVSKERPVSYAHGATQPLLLKDINPILKEQYAQCINAHGKYQALVNEQSNAINLVSSLKRDNST